MDELIALIPLISVFLIFYVILYIPQRRRQKKHKEYVESLSIGDQIITDSGASSKISEVEITVNGGKFTPDSTYNPSVTVRSC